MNKEQTTKKTAGQKNPLTESIAQIKKGLKTLIGFGFLVNMLMLAVPIYMIQIFDRVLGSGRVETLLFLTIIVGFALLIMGVLEGVRTRLTARMGAWLDDTLSPFLIITSMRGALAGLPSTAQALRDLATIRQFISGPLRVLSDILWVPLFIFAIFLLHSWLGWFAVFAAIVLFAIAYLNEILSRDPTAEASSETVKNQHLASLAIMNADVIQAMGMLRHFLNGWQARNRSILSLQRLVADRNSVLFGISRAFRMMAQAGVLGMGAYFVINNQLTPGGMIAASILLGRALGPVEQSISSGKSYLNAKGAYQRLTMLVDFVGLKPEQMTLPKPTGVLECENVSFIPKGQEKLALNNINFKLASGDVLGVLGPSSAGKTTLCKILVGTWRATAGHARLDGVDVFAWNSEELGPNVGYLPQDVELFAATIKENIARLNPEPDPEEVIDAAKLAGVHQMILKMKDGYDTEIGDGKMQLSGGQRQRIGLARALYGRPGFIVLDEPNSNLDTEGEEALVNSIEQAKKWGATLVLVTHQVRLLRPVNKVLVIYGGQQTLFGGRDEVLSKLRFKKVQKIETDADKAIKPVKTDQKS